MRHFLLCFLPCWIARSASFWARYLKQVFRGVFVPSQHRLKCPDPNVQVHCVYLKCITSPSPRLQLTLIRVYSWN
ncbi:hypothetical protein K440DRAFT_618129 [Wilcoxina mikolae CBS 423.85]|nr:hypothetical protein K440DRAFT_618129 [Wilcoxina mikolae CBS 423.85]